MAVTFRPSIFNKFKPLFQQRYANPDFSIIRSFYTKADFTTFQQPHNERTDVVDFNQSISNQTHVSTTLAAQLLSKTGPNSNVVFSPFSIHVVLSLLASGAKGQTLTQLLGFLKANTTGDLNSLYSRLVPFIMADGSKNGGTRLSIANGIWVQKTFPLKPSFKQVVDIDYKAACKQVDFMNKSEVADEVNLWAEKQTNGLIRNVLSPNAIHDLTRLILANAVYFKGAWCQKFYKSWTKEYDFHLLDGNKVQVPFMTNDERQYVQEYDDFKVLGLPYLKGRDKRHFSMYFFLPHVKDGLKSLVDKIGSTSDFIDRHIPHKKVKVRDFLIPKFKMSFEFEASNMLTELGLALPFRDVDDFTKIADLPIGERLYVSSIYQKSFVEVNEEGTEAAAVTAVCMLGTCRMTRVVDFIDFVADHPFLFVIREDETGVVLFMGHVIDPRS